MCNQQALKQYTQKLRNENNVPRHTVINEAYTAAS